MIVEEAEIPKSYDSSYFMNIDSDSVYYSAVQSATSYGILSTEYPLDLEEDLTREWCAFTLINLSMRQLNTTTNIKDRQRSIFPSHIETAVACGLMDTDPHGRFLPQDPMEKEEAYTLLQKVLSYINHPEFENNTSYQVNNDKTIQPIQFQDFDEDSLSGMTTDPVETDQLISYIDDNGNESVFLIDSVSQEEGGNRVSLQEISPLEYLDEMDISGEEELNLDNAILIEEDSQIDEIKNMSLASSSKTINGYTFSYSVSSSGLKVSISKLLDHGEKVYGELKLNGIYVKYKWLTEKKDLKNAYFSIQAHTQESLGVKAGGYKNLYGDFSSLSAENFIASLGQFLKPKNEIEVVNIPICTIRIPIESTQALTVKVKLCVKVYASGRAELTLSQDHVLGCDIRNGVVRWISDTQHNQQAVIRADTSLCSNLKFSLDFLKSSLMDISCEAGAKASISSTVHLYNDDDYEVQSLSYPLDVVEDLAQDNGNVLCCGDMKAYWILKLGLNSSSSIAGKLGLSKTISILNESNAPLFKGLNKHIENFQFVDKCTRGKRNKKIQVNSTKVTKQITLSSYNKVVHINDTQSFTITGLPDGYSKSDLRYSCEDESVARIDENGIITGISVGSTRIIISTYDEAYSISGNILVTKG